MRERAMSLQDRLAITYVIALAVGLVIVAAFSLTAIEEVLKSTLDSRLAVSERAFTASLTVEHGVVETDFRTRQRLRSILSPQQNAAIVRRDATVQMQSGAIPRLVADLAKVATETPTFADVRTEGTLLRALSVTVPGTRGVAVILWRPVDFIADYRRTGLIIFGATILVMVIAAVWAGRGVARRALEPLREMAGVASEIEASDLTGRLTVATPRDDELGRLAAAFNRMLDRLQFAFDQQRRFVADASHELRAPLAVIRAEIDLALRRERDAASYRDAMLSLRTEISHLEALIDGLLMAARVEEGFSEIVEIDVARVVREAVVRIQPFAFAKGVSIDTRIDACAVTVGDGEQLERILLALLHNAIKFGRNAVSVHVGLSGGSAALQIVVADDGPGFSDTALAHAFDRFWRERNTTRNGASGLGLTIAKATIERWGGRISVGNGPQGGGRIAIALPVQRGIDAMIRPTVPLSNSPK